MKACFLIGSGPSLNRADVTRLRAVPTITFNRAFVAWPQWRFSPTYHACVDPVVIEDNLGELASMAEAHPHTRFFLNAISASKIGCRPNVSYVDLIEGDTFSSDLSRLTDFGNVGATSMQILALLGYTRVAIIGVDARYSGSKPVGPDDDAELVVSEGAPNHFMLEYAAGKRVYAHQNAERFVRGWPLVARECTRLGIEVRNASPGTALECFERADYAWALEWIGNCAQQ